jgi:hypothetical protein
MGSELADAPSTYARVPVAVVARRIAARAPAVARRLVRQAMRLHATRRVAVIAGSGSGASGLCRDQRDRGDRRACPPSGGP